MHVHWAKVSHAWRCVNEPMITLRRSQQRQHDRRRKQEVWRTFCLQNREDPLADGFGSLQMLDESRLPPGASVPPQPHHDAEIVTYVREGTVTHADSMGRSVIIQAGEFHSMSAARSIRRVTNASPTDWAHVFQIWLRLSETREPSHDQKRFSMAERRGGLLVVAAPDARRGSLRVHENVLIHSALLERGHHVVHELSQGRSAWLHLVQGEVTLGDIVLCTGDGAGVTTERSVSFTAQEATELLLFDLGELAQASPPI
jgi:quercetin 2,3-dioxygenase